MKQTFTLLILLWTFALSAQEVVDFENFNLAVGTSLNDSGEAGGFTSGNLFFPNSYNPEFDSWTDWGISAQTDTLTPGFMNDLSAIAGGGAEGTNTYAVGAAFEPIIMSLTGSSAEMMGGGTGSSAEMGGITGGSAVFGGMYVTNNTYAALSMEQGDAFAKKFGGETGDDEDFFLLTIQKFLNGVIGSEVVQFFLADYRSADNNQDYILKDWTFVDLTPLGEADSLIFSLSSSDNGQFGMNTPAYFCIDQITFEGQGQGPPTSVKEVYTKSFELFPNPGAEYTTIHWPESDQATAAIYSMSGQQIQTHRLENGDNKIDLSSIVSGVYTIRILDNVGWQPQLLVVK